AAPRPGLLALAACAPAIGRAAAGWRSLGRAPLHLRRLGLLELTRAVWFTLLAAGALAHLPFP
ncbi:MAG: hypothetical protein ABIL09_13975, partial [Gemmatimonadota bacterium]